MEEEVTPSPATSDDAVTGDAVPVEVAPVEVVPVEVVSPSRRERHAARQRSRRTQEHQTRTSAVQFAAEHARSCRQAARRLDLSPRTLAAWKRRQALGELAPHPRGRPCREPTHDQRAVVVAILEETGPRLGLPTLRSCTPDTPPCVLAHLLDEHRREFQAEHRQQAETLHWQQAGAVWAIDHSEPPRPVDGCYTQILALRDLASGLQLAWTPVPDATAAEALIVLEGLVRAHGSPLVLKSDNGSAFKSSDFAAWLEGWQIVPLFSPVRMPRFNGACEAGIGAAKRRTEYLAARHGRPLDWTSDDLYAAQLWANDDHYPHGLAAGAPADRFAARPPIAEIARDNFHAAVVQYEDQLNREFCTASLALTDTLRAMHHRRAVRRALVELGYLDITRRSIPQPLPPAKRAGIT
ncbi:MAG TPA: DDE-type integrase/transposase/recombinase [Burkholderiales bacterium]|nr:DDE-type integrase/transposase/recombinase [Burkholderiales bacterium]